MRRTLEGEGIEKEREDCYCKSGLTFGSGRVTNWRQFKCSWCVKRKGGRGVRKGKGKTIYCKSGTTSLLLTRGSFMICN